MQSVVPSACGKYLDCYFDQVEARFEIESREAIREATYEAMREAGVLVRVSRVYDGSLYVRTYFPLVDVRETDEERVEIERVNMPSHEIHRASCMLDSCGDSSKYTTDLSSLSIKGTRNLTIAEMITTTADTLFRDIERDFPKPQHRTTIASKRLYRIIDYPALMKVVRYKGRGRYLEAMKGQIYLKEVTFGCAGYKLLVKSCVIEINYKIHFGDVCGKFFIQLQGRKVNLNIYNVGEIHGLLHACKIRRFFVKSDEVFVSGIPAFKCSCPDSMLEALEVACRIRDILRSVTHQDRDHHNKHKEKDNS